MTYTFCVDFGSTFTKLCVLDLARGELVMTTKHPTTVGTDASIALLAGLAQAKRYVGEKGVKEGRIVTSSSAAGGLRMVVVGLTKRFSLLAGKNVALGAGARIIKTYANYLTEENVCEIEKINPEILLLCGGIEGGNVDRILYNAKMLKEADISSYVVYAGNQEVAPYIRQELVTNSIPCYMTENVFPAYGQLNAAPAGNIIRQLFMERIAGAKGLASAFPIIGQVLMPTPAAVLAGGQLLAQGTDKESGLGSLMVFDVGGATTDVYSYMEETGCGAKHVGSPEPFAKRTVEGDLGVRSSCLSLAEAMNLTAGAKRAGRSAEQFLSDCRRRAAIGTYVPDNEFQKEVDVVLAEGAVEISARRHCGKVTNAYARKVSETLEGKDLREIGSMVGTGGPIIHSGNPAGLLSQALRRPWEKELLLPEESKFYLDKRYILYAIGLCAGINPAGALHIAKENIVEVD